MGGEGGVCGQGAAAVEDDCATRLAVPVPLDRDGDELVDDHADDDVDAVLLDGL